MKIVVESDCHLNKASFKGVLDKKYNTLPFRTVDFMKAHKYIVDKVVNEIKPDLFVLAGDTYETYDPSNQIRSFANNSFKKMLDAGVEVILLVGNHDVCKKHHSLSPLKSMSIDNLSIIEEPEIKIYKNKALLLFPYSLVVERGEKEIRQQFLEFIEDSKKITKDFKSEDIFFFGHFGVRGAILKEYHDDGERLLTNKTTTPMKSYKKNNQKDISPEDLDNIGAKYVFLGDYHKHQVLQTQKCYAMYTGSIERTDITEHNQKKGFVIYDDNNEEIEKYGKARFDEYKKCRPMIELRGNVIEIKKELENIDKNKFKNAIVRIKFIGSRKELEVFSSELDNIKNRIGSLINPIHIYSEQTIIDEDQERKFNELEEQMLEKGFINEDLVLEVVKESIKELENEEQERKILIKMAEDIYKESKEG